MGMEKEIVAEKEELKLRVRYLPAAEKICVLGNTYTVKEELKKMGFRWDAEKECWVKSVSLVSQNNIREIIGKVIKELEQKFGAKVLFYPIGEAIRSIEYACSLLEWVNSELQNEELSRVLENVGEALKFLEDKRSDYELALFEK
jgi:hypothetical protein